MAIDWTPARLEVDLNYKSKDIILASEWNNLWKETRLQGNNNTDGILLLIETVEGNIGHLTNLDNLFADLESKVTAHTGNSDIHVTSTQKTAWTAKYDKPSGGIPKTDLASAVQSSLDKADTALQQHQDISALTAHVANSSIHVTVDNKAAWSAKYDKPSSGIPKSDLASSVQTSLGKADTALQEHQDISALTSHVANNSIHVTTDDKTSWNSKYNKPSGGIPKTDLASDIQTSLVPSSLSSDAGKILTVSSSGNAVWAEATSSGSGGKSAYAYAVEGGYALTESDFTTDLGNLHNLPTHISNTNIHIDSAERTAWNAKYDKPSSGIPKSDLASDIQTSLAKADASAETYLVVFNTVDFSSWTADKTYAEILAANEAGKIVRCSVFGVAFGQLVVIGDGEILFTTEVFASELAGIYLFTVNSSNEVSLRIIKYYSSTFSQYTILTSGWSSGVYSFESVFPSATYDIEIELDSTATESQVEAWSSAKVTAVFGTNTMKALGDVPTVDIPVIVKKVIK